MKKTYISILQLLMLVISLFSLFSFSQSVEAQDYGGCYVAVYEEVDTGGYYEPNVTYVFDPDCVVMPPFVVTPDPDFDLGADSGDVCDPLSIAYDSLACNDSLDSCDPLSSRYDPYDCYGSIDPCDPLGVMYDPLVCEPISVVTPPPDVPPPPPPTYMPGPPLTGSGSGDEGTPSDPTTDICEIDPTQCVVPPTPTTVTYCPDGVTVDDGNCPTTSCPEGTEYDESWPGFCRPFIASCPEGTEFDLSWPGLCRPFTSSCPAGFTLDLNWPGFCRPDAPSYCNQACSDIDGTPYDIPYVCGETPPQCPSCYQVCGEEPNLTWTEFTCGGTPPTCPNPICNLQCATPSGTYNVEYYCVDPEPMCPDVPFVEFRQCPSGAWVITTEPCPDETEVKTCPSGVVVPITDTCPTGTHTCADGTVLPDSQPCPSETKTCPSGAVVPIYETCPTSTQTCPNGAIIDVNDTCPSDTKTCPDGSVIDASDLCPTATCNDVTANNYGGASPCTYNPAATCVDATATNIGSPLPCTYNPTTTCNDTTANNYGSPIPCSYGTSHTLTVDRSGSGTGIVSGGGINCGSNCTQSILSGQSITLSANPAPGSEFGGWSGGGCSGTGSCNVTMDTSKTVTAAFVLPMYTVTVTKPGSGTGVVTGGGISCGSTCSKAIQGGQNITLTASPSSGSQFTGWSGGGCSGTGSCNITVNSNTNVSATFGSLSAGSTCTDVTASNYGGPLPCDYGPGSNSGYTLTGESKAGIRFKTALGYETDTKSLLVNPVGNFSSPVTITVQSVLSKAAGQPLPATTVVSYSTDGGYNFVPAMNETLTRNGSGNYVNSSGTIGVAYRVRFSEQLAGPYLVTFSASDGVTATYHVLEIDPKMFEPQFKEI